LPGRA
jgi:hypothetical protein